MPWAHGRVLPHPGLGPREMRWRAQLVRKGRGQCLLPRFPNLSSRPLPPFLPWTPCTTNSYPFSPNEAVAACVRGLLLHTEHPVVLRPERPGPDSWLLGKQIGTHNRINTEIIHQQMLTVTGGSKPRGVGNCLPDVSYKISCQTLESEVRLETSSFPNMKRPPPASSVKRSSERSKDTALPWVF